ncbi:MAG: hypothetical protein WBI20_02205, partial [Burkholderiaceae bacterium]
MPLRRPPQTPGHPTELPLVVVGVVDVVGFGKHYAMPDGPAVRVSGRRPDSRLLHSSCANEGVNAALSERTGKRPRAWAGERAPNPPALPTPTHASGFEQFHAKTSR